MTEVSIIKYESNPDNSHNVYQFIGPQPECELCGGYGEYESDGPKPCYECLSRLIPFIDYKGDRVTAEWGDFIVRRGNGLHLLKGSENEQDQLFTGCD